MRRMKLKRKHLISEDLSYLSKLNWAYIFDLNIILHQEGRKWREQILSNMWMGPNITKVY